jgi:hypothetical protein
VLLRAVPQFDQPLPAPAADWFRTTLVKTIDDLTSYHRRQSSALKRRKSELTSMQDRLLNAYLAGTVEEVIYKAKLNELKSEAARTNEALAKLGDVAPSHRELALEVFDWSQRATAEWHGSNHQAGRQILNAVYLNRTLSDATLVTTKRKPFDVFAKRPQTEISRADCRLTIVNETAGVSLLLQLMPKTVAFKGDAVLALVQPGIYRKHRRKT